MYRVRPPLARGTVSTPRSRSMSSQVARRASFFPALVTASNAKAAASSWHSGSYAFWLGSGISRDRVIGLRGVLAKLLEFLRVRVTASAACFYRAAFDKIIGLAAPSDDERAEIDLAVPMTNWACIENLLKRLWGQYSAVLSVQLPGEKLDYLLWVGLDFPNTFASQPPDAEHLAISMLALEGAVTEFASANCDGLVESALSELGYDESFFRNKEMFGWLRWRDRVSLERSSHAIVCAAQCAVV